MPEEHRGRRILVEFEGVYRDAMVYVNGNYAGQRPYGYSLFRIDADRFLRFGAGNEIRVEARAHKDSRWYTGAGIYRGTWLLTGGLVRIAPDGVRVTTPDTDTERAVVEVAATVENDSIAIRTPRIRTEIRDAAGNVVAVEESPVSVLPGEPATARQRLYVRAPVLWSPESPALYTAHVTLTGDEGETDAGSETDAETVTFGIRSLRLDPAHGLRINGETVKLRGACVHHDNGVLGAATFARAEERRVQILKDAGFNAIRMAHHPMSTAMLDACDRLGVLVMDEAFDMWTSAKSDFDYSLHFPQWWEADIEAMVAKDVNHPSVIVYSIGNEIPETGSPAGAAWGRKLAEKVRALDGTRYVTNAVNGMLAVLDDLAAMRSKPSEDGINTLMADPGDMMNAISSSTWSPGGRPSRSACSTSPASTTPRPATPSTGTCSRTGSSSAARLSPPAIDGNWRLVSQYPNVIGDFTWTGWDYLGEAGIGRPQYATADGTRPSFNGPYPWLLAGCGDIDITGHRRPASYYREIVFGLRDRPYLAVQRPEHHGKTWTGTPWAWSDSVASWTWPGSEGAPVTVEVYSDADEVELLLNSQSLGRKPAGDSHRFRAEFETLYQPGELLAIAYTAGTETGRHLLRSAAGPLQLRAETDRHAITADSADLAYVSLTLTDPAGTCCTHADRPVRLEVTGQGVLLGFGSAVPATEERFDATERRTYDGRALAVLRPMGPGKIRLTATAPECEPAEIVITAE